MRDDTQPGLDSSTAVIRPERARWLLTALLLVVGATLCLAFPCLLLPEATMASTHRWLGLGEFPQAPITLYLARSACVLYGMHGVLLLVIARDVTRHASLVTAVGVLHTVMGAAMFVVDLTAGMPWYWTVLEGPPVAAGGLVVLVLQRLSLESRGVSQTGDAIDQSSSRH